MPGVDDHETVSVYPLDDADLEQLLTKSMECTFNWGTQDGWPVGVIMSFLWKAGRFWLTAGAHRHRIAAVRRDPRVSVVVSGAAAPPGTAPFGAATAKGHCLIHEDRETKDWFYPEFAAKLNSTDPEAAAAFVRTLDSPLRVVLEVIPKKWILFDGIKFGSDAAGSLSAEQKGPMLSSDAERMPRELARRGLS